MVGCRVRLLLTDAVRHISYEYLRPLSLSEIHTLHSFPLVLPDYLSRSLPQRGRRKTLYEEVTSYGIGDTWEEIHSATDIATDESNKGTEGDPELAAEFDSGEISNQTGVSQPVAQTMGSIIDPDTGVRRSARTATINLTEASEPSPIGVTSKPCAYTVLVAAFNQRVFGEPCPSLDPQTTINSAAKAALVTCNTISTSRNFATTNINVSDTTNDDADCKNNIQNRPRKTRGRPKAKARVRFAPSPSVRVFDGSRPPAEGLRGIRNIPFSWPGEIVSYKGRKCFAAFLTYLARLREDLSSVKP